jgi:hypothetical protein
MQYQHQQSVVVCVWFHVPAAFTLEQKMGELFKVFAFSNFKESMVQTRVQAQFWLCK